MDKPPTRTKPSRPNRAKPPEELDADLQRALLRAAETCQQRFDEHPTRYAYQLREILEALGRDPHLIDAVHRLLEGRTGNPAVAPVVAIGGEPVRRRVQTKDGDLVFQKIRGRPWEGPVMVNRTRWAIGAYDADPLNVATAVMRGLPPLLKADCQKYAAASPERVGLAIAPLLDNDLRNALIALRKNCRDANMDDEQADAQCIAYLEKRSLKELPAKVLRAILKELGHPAPDNLTR
jgi:hypothetical protein